MLHRRVHDAFAFCFHARMSMSFSCDWRLQDGPALSNLWV